MHATDFSNPWVASVDAAPRRAHAIVVILVGVLAGLLCLVWGQPAGLALAQTLEAGGLDHPMGGEGRLYVAVITAVVFLPMVLVAFISSRIEGRRIWLHEANPLLALLGGLVLGGAGFGAVVGLGVVAGVIPVSEVVATPEAAAPLIAAGLALIAVQVWAEELFFRGWIQPVLCARWGPWLGGAVTALLFAGLHLAGGARSPMTLLNLLLAGGLFGMLALRSGGLWAPFGAHFAWNSLEAIGLGLEPDPGVGPFGAVVNLELSGAALWSGGEDRLNGSLATTLVLAALVMLMAAWGPGRRRQGSGAGPQPQG
jgi:uncharacterized protein